ncbi:MAG: mechanosensitive ion channel [Verrucomicrobiales bacterium]|nr:mechanosensitive ion channel [Verrucomicrobiales bacterium]
MNFESFDLSQIDLERIFVEFVIPYGSNLLFSILILFLGLFVVRMIVGTVGKTLTRTRLDQMLINFVSNLLRWILLLLVIVAALDQLGVDTTSFIAVLGAAGLAVGLALKDSLQNFASGVMLILFRPFRTGDTVEAGGAEGVVEEIRIFSTQLRTPDNREVTVPNSDIYSGKIVNNSARETRRIDLVFGIGYEDDLRLAKTVVEELLRADDRILTEPAPFIAVGELGASSVDILVRPWVKTGDYFQVKCDLLERVKLAYDEKGISIPYPQMDVHFDSAGGAQSEN